MPFTEGTLPSYPRPHLSPTPTLTAPCLVAVPDRISFPEKEEEILAWWEENGVFQESLKQSLGKPVWSFYDGPPFATGLPHYGHLLAGTIKVHAHAARPSPARARRRHHRRARAAPRTPGDSCNPCPPPMGRVDLLLNQSTPTLSPQMRSPVCPARAGT